MSSRIYTGAHAAEPLVFKRVPGGGAPFHDTVADFRGGGPAGVQQQIAAIQEQASVVARESYERGFRDGEAKIREQTAAELQAGLERLANAAAEVLAAGPRIRREAERSLVQLSIAIARRILHRELSIDPDALAGVIRVALERLDRQDTVRIRIRPEDAGPLRRILEAKSYSDAPIVPDASLHSGSVLIETNAGVLDASLDTQLAEIESGLADRMGIH
jgi:flagellar assembly protein FliH